jgi:hypothetical protein
LLKPFKGKSNEKKPVAKKKSTIFLCAFVCFKTASLKPCKGKPSGENQSEKIVQSAKSLYCPSLT